MRKFLKYFFRVHLLIDLFSFDYCVSDFFSINFPYLFRFIVYLFFLFPRLFCDQFIFIFSLSKSLLSPFFLSSSYIVTLSLFSLLKAYSFHSFIFLPVIPSFYYLTILSFIRLLCDLSFFPVIPSFYFLLILSFIRLFCDLSILFFSSFSIFMSP